MAQITDIVADHFRVKGDAESLIMDLDAGFAFVGIAVRMIRDMAVHGTTGGGSEVDPEEIAVAATGLLAHLGHLGSLIDRLEAQTSKPAAAIGAGMAGRVERP